MTAIGYFPLLILLPILSLTGEATGMPTIQHLPGLVQQIMLGGRNARKGEFPYMVSLKGMFPSSSRLEHFCGGSIITHHTVLTAAHCVIKESSMWVVAGEHDLSYKEGTEQIREVIRYKIHEGYDELSGVSSNDIAILYVDEPFQFNEYVDSIPLAKPINKLTEGIATISGWGDTEGIFGSTPDILKTEPLPILPLESCHKIVKDIRYSNDFVSESMLCTGPFKHFGPCSGDSGSPLTMKGLLIGITSWAIMPCGSYDVPAGFTRISSFIDWIMQANQEVRTYKSTLIPNLNNSISNNLT